MDLIWLIPVLPLLGFCTLVVLGRRFGDPGAGVVATAAVGASFLVVVKVFFDLLALPSEERVFTQTLFTWIPSGSFEVSIETTLSLQPRVGAERLLITESGVLTRADVQRLRSAGVEAFLVGEAFMRALDPGRALAELFN